jgi:hypothetical protein
MTDFKEELMAAWDKAILLPRTGRLAEYRAWLAHALALVWAVGRRPTTKPVGPSDEVSALQDACDAYDYAYRESAGMAHTGFGPARGTVHHQAGLRAAVLARYARPTIEPVPVSERPWEREGWCNSDNEAFFFDSDTKKWSLCECDKYSPVMTNASDRYTHSLPHNALPVPGAEVQS